MGAGDQPNNIVNLGRLKVVNPPSYNLVHGDDGYFRMPDGNPAPAATFDPSLKVLSGVLEGSNANPMSSMVSLIDNARRYEMQMQVIKNVDTNEQKANGILSMQSS